LKSGRTHAFCSSSNNSSGGGSSSSKVLAVVPPVEGNTLPRYFVPIFCALCPAL